jgi:hypothetical protein
LKHTYLQVNQIFGDLFFQWAMLLMNLEPAVVVTVGLLWVLWVLQLQVGVPLLEWGVMGTLVVEVEDPKGEMIEQI